MGLPKSRWQKSWGGTEPACQDPWDVLPTEDDSDSSYSSRGDKQKGSLNIISFQEPCSAFLWHYVGLWNVSLNWKTPFLFHSQLQKFCPQLILFILPLSAHSPVCSLALHLIIRQVMSDFLNKRSDEIYHVSAATAKRKDVILLLLLGVRERQFGHLVQHRRQRHAQGWCLTAAQAHEHCKRWEKENTPQ